MKHLLLTVALTSAIANASKIHHRHEHIHLRGTDPLTKTGWSTTFLETFSHKTASKQPSDKDWIYDLGTSYPGGAERWGNKEHETYTDSLDNVKITDNTLVITPIKQPNGTWTSARIETQRTDFAAAPGGKLLIEASIKLPVGNKSTSQGIWPAFWALGESFRGNPTNWPMASEWDMMEVMDGDNSMFTTLHCGPNSPGGPCKEYTGLSNVADGGVAFSRGVWHTVGLQVDRSMCGSSISYEKHNNTTCWKQETLEWFLDGALVFGVSGGDVGVEGVWKKVAHEGHFLLLDVAVGGNWPGPPNNATQGGKGAEMAVDWVGVWNSL